MDGENNLDNVSSNTQQNNNVLNNNQMVGQQVSYIGQSELKNSQSNMFMPSSIRNKSIYK